MLSCKAPDPLVKLYVDEEGSPQARPDVEAADAVAPWRVAEATQVNGRPLDTFGLTRRTYRQLLRKAGLPKEIRFHDLWHTFLSHALQAGANPRAVSEVVGHFDAGFTLRRYAHALCWRRTGGRRWSGWPPS